MEYRILGPVEVLDGGAGVTLDGTKQRTVLAALLISGDSLLADPKLSAALWGDRPPATLSAQLYTQVSRLRKALGGRASIIRHSSGYLMRLEGARLDLLEFENLAARGRAAQLAGRFDEAGRLLRAGLALWRGPALADVSEHLAAAEGPAIEEARLSVLESRIEADLVVGMHGRVLPELTRLVGQYPLRERFCAQLMTALYRGDRQAEALALYDRRRRMLAEELGIEPGPLLRQVHQAILTADPVLDRLLLVG
ncbi:AfsR/SARP family transcriptional regulator [Kutzneria buriramensis]|uniref:DNA-binding SARP family transcriptional activator n=1 Tax=Kutzneria buriramensis TaxID=1045776 RepID=A0A3E0HKM6_9PSEU|nr:AfsR/SARP family transcriptional regulator [Kutzneria buriramensis]REH46918.1 DNA-binding SARP family transcriptional activator [Kutzneria buriramensis]